MPIVFGKTHGLLSREGRARSDQVVAHRDWGVAPAAAPWANVGLQHAGQTGRGSSAAAGALTHAAEPQDDVDEEPRADDDRDAGADSFEERVPSQERDHDAGRECAGDDRERARRKLEDMRRSRNNL